MRIGAYELSSQMNIYSKFSAESIKKVQDLNKEFPSKTEKNDDTAVSLSIDGKDYSAPVTYSKYAAAGKVANATPKLDDFSLVSAKEDVKISRLPESDADSQYKEVISDKEMDSFLKKVFKLYE